LVTKTLFFITENLIHSHMSSILEMLDMLIFKHEANI